MVEADDPRLDDDENYSTRKPSKKKLREEQVKELLPTGLSKGTKEVIGAVAAPAALKAAQVAARKVPTIVKALAKTEIPVGRGAQLSQYVATLGSAKTLGLLGLAGFGSYFATRWIIDNFPTRQRRLNAAADAYRQSRRELAGRLGRELTAAEQRELAAHYKSVVAEINRSLI